MPITGHTITADSVVLRGEDFDALCAENERLRRELTHESQYQRLTSLWQSRYFEALLELRKVNKGAQRLRRRLDNANRNLRRAGRPMDEREPPHCPTCGCGVEPKIRELCPECLEPKPCAQHPRGDPHEKA